MNDGLPILEANQDRTGRDPELEQVGRVTLVRAARGEVYHQSKGQTGHGGHSGYRPFLHDYASEREVQR
ncbi:MAG: hypothetical protein R2940_17635 [Syntrophotaleaceae bacterium]